MSVESSLRAVTTYRLTEMKQRGEKIAMLTSYDYSMARIVDAAGVDVILVGDSAANVMAGYETTLPITLDMMIYHARSVVRAVSRALVVVDLPFGAYQGNSKVALDSAVRIMKETEADAVKMEGGEEILESVQRILSAGIPVMGHLGLTPQSIHKFGTYTVRAKEEAEAAKLVRDAHLLSDAGCFAVVLEKIPAALAGRVTREISAPTIGIGAGGACDGQVLVDLPMEPEQCSGLSAVLEQHGVDYTLESRDETFAGPKMTARWKFTADAPDKPLNSEAARWRKAMQDGMSLTPLDRYDGQPIYKIVYIAEHLHDLDEAKRLYQDQFVFCESNLDTMDDGMVNGELINRKFDKGTGIRAICRHLGHPQEDTIGFGDSDNDLQMTQAAGISVCMGNGSERLKQLCDRIAPTVYEDGLAREFAALGLTE